jgi:hypothetical protein
MEDTFLLQKTDPDLSLLEDVLTLTSQNIGDIFFILNDLVKPASSKIGILESINIDESNTSFKIATFNFVTSSEETFFLRTIFRGELDFFSPPTRLGGELFEKYKIFKINKHSVSSDKLLESLKQITKNDSIILNNEMKIENTPLEKIREEFVVIKKTDDSKSKENLLRDRLEQEKQEAQKKAIQERIEKAIARKAKEEAKKQTRNDTVLGEMPANIPKNVPSNIPKNVPANVSTQSLSFKHKYMKYKLKYIELLGKLN